MMLGYWKGRKRLELFSYFALLGIGISLILSPPIQLLDRKIYDIQLRTVAAITDPAPPADVVIVGIDEKTETAFREPLALWHSYFGKLFSGLSQGSPKAVVVDVILPDRSYEFMRKGIDRELLSGLLALKQRSNLVIARTIDDQGHYRRLFAPIMSLMGEERVGLALVHADKDQVVRNLYPAIQGQNDELPALAGSLAKQLGIEASEGLINYAINGPYPYIPMSEVVALYDAGQQELLREKFSGKYVFIGSVLPFIDRHQVPIAIAGWEGENTDVPGVLIHAQSARTLLHKAVIHPVWPGVPVLLFFLISALWWSGHKTRIYAGIGIGFGLLVLPVWLIMMENWLPVSGVVIMLIILLSGRAALDAWYSWKEKHVLKSSFSRYVCPQVMDDILVGKIQPGIGGKRSTVCMLFSDIRGFTARSEGEEPEIIIHLLNRYFNEMTKSVSKYGGTIDKFIGDGLMAFFGEPNQHESPAASATNAFLCARDMLDRLEALNRELKEEGIKAIEIGIGLHLGEAVIGHVGSDTRHEYTAIGDTVNLAARLEGLTKDIGYPVVCSEAVKELLDVPLDALGETPVKGHTPVLIYGWKP